MADHQTIDEGALVARCLPPSAEGAACKELVRRYGRLVWYAIRWTARRFGCECPTQQTEDICQDTFLALFQDDCAALRKYDPERGRLGTLLAGIARNKTINWLKSSQRKSVPIDDLQLVFEGSPEEQVEAGERREALSKAAAALSARDRLFYQLHFRDLLPPEQIAGILGIGVDTVYSKKAKIVEHLRRIMTGPR
jgi:RNA polymerase sigma factor (sigma-70 family)